MHHFHGALPMSYVPVRVTRGTVIACRNTYASPRCRTSQYRRTFILLSVSPWYDLGYPVFYGVRLAGFKSRANAFLLALMLAPCLSLAVFPIASFIRIQPNLSIIRIRFYVQNLAGSSFVITYYIISFKKIS